MSAAQIIPNMSNAEYHARDEVSKSSLWYYREKGAAAYWHKFIGRDAPEDKPSAAMDLGTLVHAALLEPYKLKTDFAVWPADVLSVDGKATTKSAKEFAAVHSGKTLLKADDWEAAGTMVANASDVICSWFRCRPSLETSIFWSDKETELPCRCRCDFLANLADRVIVADVKTCRDASPLAFRRAIENHGYWMQDAFYSSGVEAAYGKPVTFVFVAVQSTFPYPVAIYELSDVDKEAAKYHTATAVESIAGRYRRNDWKDEWTGNLNTLVLSRFAFDQK